MFVRRGDNEQGEEVREVSSSSKPEGGTEEGNKEERRAKCSQDQKSQCLGWVWERESMWMSVCGSAGRLTSGLHYKRKAP